MSDKYKADNADFPALAEIAQETLIGRVGIVTPDGYALYRSISPSSTVISISTEPSQARSTTLSQPTLKSLSVSTSPTPRCHRTGLANNTDAKPISSTSPSSSKDVEHS